MHDNDTNNNLQSQSSNITFGKKIYQFKLEDINTFTQQFYCNMIEYSDELKLGMHHLIDCLDLWLKEIFDDAEFDNEALIEIYNAVKLFNGDRIRATEKFNNKKEYSNVAIKWTISDEQEDELVFGQVCLFIKCYIILLFL
jgi:hypothetical protein